VARAKTKNVNNTSCTVGTAADIEDGSEYEYVWDMPSNAINAAESRTVPPDLLQVDTTGGGASVGGSRRQKDGQDRSTSSRGQCSCLGHAQTLPQGLNKYPPPTKKEATMTNDSSGSSSSRYKTPAPGGRFSSLEARSRPPTTTAKSDKQIVDIQTTGRHKGYVNDSVNASSQKTCRKCGHIVSDYSAVTLEDGSFGTPPRTDPPTRRIPAKEWGKTTYEGSLASLRGAPRSSGGVGVVSTGGNSSVPSARRTVNTLTHVRDYH